MSVSPPESPPTEPADAAAAAPPPGGGFFRDALSWYVGTSAYWFAVSLKWFIVFLLQPIQVANVVPGGEANSSWGTVVSLGAAEAMIGPALFGFLSDRFRGRFGRRRPFIAIGAALTSVALLFLAGANSLPLMMFAYLFLQVSDDVATGPYASVVADAVPEEHRGKASGTINMVQLIAQIAAVAIAIPLGDIAKIYTAIAVINIVFAVITLYAYREPPALQSAAPPAESRTSDPEERVRKIVAGWVAPFRSADYRWTWISRFLGAFGFYLILVYVSNYLKDSVHDLTVFGAHLAGTREAEVQNATLVAALTIALSGALTAVHAGKLTDSIGRKRVIIGAGWLMFATLVPFALVPDYDLMLLLAVAFGVGYGAYISATWALAADVLPSKEDAAKDMGIWQASISSPQIVAGMVGFLVDFGNRQRPGMGYSTAFLISAFAFLAGCLLVTRIKGAH
jgi:Major Facilitator Superfamily.